ncbi:MAG: GNAT family N-acetyltransferase [Alphaproteobacteria bacterium]
MTIALRHATAADEDRLFHWVNDPASLINKRQTQTAIPRQQHHAWLQSTLHDPGTHLWIVESDHVPVGQIRLTCQQDTYEVDIFVTGSHRRHGYALAALKAALAELEATQPDARVVARIMRYNTNSVRLFERAGFVATTEQDDDDHLIYRRQQRSTL